MRSMVYTGERGMAGPERSKTHNNFQFPWKWGSQRYLRCVNLNNASTATDSSSAAADQHQHHRPTFHKRRSPPSKPEYMTVGGKRRRESESSQSKNKSNGRQRELRISNGEADEGIEGVRVKLTKDLITAADEIRFSLEAAGRRKNEIFRYEVPDDDGMDNDEDEFEGPNQKVKDKGKERKTKEKEREESHAMEVETRPWNLRTRRAKFSLHLSKIEIQEDLMTMMGGRHPPRRAKKRSRFIQDQLDPLLAGSLLREVTVDDYKVPELGESSRRW